MRVDSDPSNAGELGATFVEVLAALALLAVVAGLLWFAAGGGVDSLRRALAVRREAVALLEATRSLRRAAGRVRPAYWIGGEFGAGIETEDNLVRVPHLDGDGDQWLVLDGDAGLTIKTSGGDRREFRGLSVSTIEILTERDVPYAVVVVFDSDRVGSLRVHAAFGTTTVPSVRGESRR